MRAFVVLTNGKNGTIGRQNPFKVLPMEVVQKSGECVTFCEM